MTTLMEPQISSPKDGAASSATQPNGRRQTSTGDAPSRRATSAPRESAIMNRLVTGTFVAFCVSATAAGWVLSVRSALWLFSG